MKPARLRRRRPTGAGLTLIELLVSLAIVAMVAALLSQALWQLARTERLLASGQLPALSQSVRIEWLRSTLESLQPVADGQPDALRGTERELSGLATQAPLPEMNGPQRLQLRLVYDELRQITRLEMSLADPAQPLPLLQWPGRAGRLRYLAADGQWHEQWPVPTVTAVKNAWPLALAIETGLAQAPLIVAAPQLRPPALPTRREVQTL